MRKHFAEVEGVLVDTRHWIAGRRVASATTFTDISPIDEQPIAEVHAGGQAEIAAAVAAAREAFPASTPGARTWPGWKPATTAHCCARTGAA